MGTKNKKKHEICKILEISDKTYYNWKEKRKPIILLLEKYFDRVDLREFLETEKMTKLEYYNQASTASEDDFILLSGIFKKIGLYTKNNDMDHEKFILKYYLTLRDMPDDGGIDIYEYLKNYDMMNFEFFDRRMVSTGTEDIVEFYKIHLSVHELSVQIKHKLYLLPVLRVGT